MTGLVWREVPGSLMAEDLVTESTKPTKQLWDC
uniref:Uncharacterized protein n=1 Tax=Anguilla anguilla TaxID=7936 RepID=A0A0E9REE7_ANGAN